MSKFDNLAIGDIVLLTKNGNPCCVSQINKIVSNIVMRFTNLGGFLNNNYDHCWYLHTTYEPEIDITFLFKPDPSTPVHLQIQQLYPELSL